MSEFKSGWPRYFWSHDFPIVYEVKIKPNFQRSFDLAEVVEAVVDASTQYQAEGLRWKLADSPYTSIYPWWVDGWREIEEKVCSK